MKLLQRLKRCCSIIISGEDCATETEFVTTFEHPKLLLSDVIFSLEFAKRKYGNLPVCSHGGDISTFEVSPSLNGVVPNSDETPNEIFIEINDNF